MSLKAQIQDLLLGDETMDASHRVGSPVQQANQPTAGLHTFDPRPAAVLQPPPTFSAVQAPPPQMQVYPPPTAQQVMARPLAGPPRSGPPSQGNRLLVDAVESGKITRDEAILLQNTLAEAKKRSLLNPSVIPKDFVTSTLRSELGDERARAVISAVAQNTPRSRPVQSTQQLVGNVGQLSSPPSVIIPSNGSVNEHSQLYAPSVTKSPSRVGAVVAGYSPPGLNMIPDQSAKAQKKRGGRVGTDEASNNARKKVAKTASSIGEKHIVAPVVVQNKMDHGLEPVDLDEYETAGHRPVGGKGVKGETTSSLLESVIPSDLASAEEQQAREARRAAAGGPYSTGLRIGSSLLGLYSSAQTMSSWDDDKVMTRAKIIGISEQILGKSNPALTIDEDAVKYIAFCSQNLLKDIIDASITSSRRRRNQTAVQQFDKIQQLMHLPGNERGVPIPEHGHNLGMAWFNDVESATLSAALGFVETYDKAFSDLKAQIKDDLIKYDEERKLSGKKRQLSGAASTTELDDYWWITDAQAEKNGLLSWPEIAMAQLRLKIAEEFELGPSRQRRRILKGKADDADSTNGITTAMEVSNDYKISTAPSSANHTSSASRNNAEWAPVRCPLASEEGDVVSKADVIRNLNKRSVVRCAGGYFAEQLGNSLYRAKLDLPSIL